MPARRCSECGRNRQERFFTGPRGYICTTCQKRKRRETAHKGRVRRTYGLLDGEYEALLEAQGGACGGCGETRSYKLHVDHDHAIEREAGSRASVRGLLCARCNKLLRDCRDNAMLLRFLADYLDNPPARRVIR